MGVQNVQIDVSRAGQRIDNFLMTVFKGVPKSRVYRAIRGGEVRVNKGRVKASYRLQEGDCLRIPPLRVPAADAPKRVPSALLKDIESRMVYEDEDLWVINKPTGVSVHGGSGVPIGLMEVLAALRPDIPDQGLVHRLDRETSGCLLIAKHRAALLEWQSLFSERLLNKCYLLRVKGRWSGGTKVINEPLRKNVLQSGERMVLIDPEGKSALTRFHLLRHEDQTSLLLAEPVTGRTHQIRVHAACMGYPIVGDTKYGDRAFNQAMRQQGLSRLCLHALSLARKNYSNSRFNGICVLPDKEMLEIHGGKL